MIIFILYIIKAFIVNNFLIIVIYYNPIFSLTNRFTLEYNVNCNILLGGSHFFCKAHHLIRIRLYKGAVMGLIHIYTGNGKGKTTAAAGLCLRMLGHGKRVLFFQFMKNHSSGEVAALKTFKNAVIPETIPSVKFTKDMTDSEKAELYNFYSLKWNEITAESKRCELVVLDEAVTAVNKGFLDIDMLIDFLKTSASEIVITGRNAPEELLSLGDYICEIKSIRHPFDKGIAARKGIEF